MADIIVRATAADDQIRAFAAYTKDTVEEARRRHDTSPTATVALGQLLTAGAMMGSMMKGDTDILTLQIRCDGPLEGLTVTADNAGNVKGYVFHPEAAVPPKNGKIDITEALGLGVLNVIQDLGLKEPYIGQTILETSEIAQDLTYYYMNSEQIPSSVGLGVLMDKDNTVRCAGGFIIQLMPFAEEATIDKLEQNLKQVSSVTELLSQGCTAEDLLEILLGNLGLTIRDTIPARFHCNCSKERVEQAVVSIGRKDIKEMIEEGKDIEVKCHFCNTAYNFTIDELEEILEKA